VPASLAPGTGKVSDECLFGFQGARGKTPSQFPLMTFLKICTLFLKFFKKIFWK
jgi:hypothetical protein